MLVLDELRRIEGIIPCIAVVCSGTVMPRPTGLTSLGSALESCGAAFAHQSPDGPAALSRLHSSIYEYQSGLRSPHGRYQRVARFLNAGFLNASLKRTTTETVAAAAVAAAVAVSSS